MNRQQRRAQKHLEMVNLRDVTYPWQMTDMECEMMLADRLMMNLLETGHPFHHKTASGVIVEPDPTAEYYLSRLPEEKRRRVREGWLTRVKSDAPQAAPVNRKFYGHDMYARQ